MGQIADPYSNNTIPTPLLRQDSVSGFFIAFKNYIVVNGRYDFVDSRQYAMLKDSLVGSGTDYIFRPSDAGRIYLNGKAMSKSADNYYSGQNYTDWPLTWSKDAGGGFDAFSCNLNINYPQYEGAHYLPDTIRLNYPFTFMVNGTDADSVSVHMENTGEDPHLIVKKTKPDVIVRFTEDELNLLSSFGNTPVEMLLELSKVEYKVCGGKSYKFKTGIYIQKHITIVK